MSRSTNKTLRRLVVPGVAAATAVAGLPLFLGSAMAAPVGTITLAPLTTGSTSAAAGTCQAYVITGVPATAGTSTVGETVNVIVTDTSTNATSNPRFCTAPTGGVTPASGTVISQSGAQAGGLGVDQSSFTLAAQAANSADTAAQATERANTGRVVIGIVNDFGPSTQNVRVYSDRNADQAFTAGEPTVTGVNTVTSGGAAGSNQVQDATKTLTASGPATAVVGETTAFDIATENAQGDTLAGVRVRYSIPEVTGANAAAAQSGECGLTDNDGNLVCSIALNGSGAAGTANRTVTFFANQTTGATAGPDAGEPAATVTLAVTPGPNASTIAIAPVADGTAVPYQTNPAINPTDDGNRDFRISVDNGTGATGSSAGRPVRVVVTGGSGDETVNTAVGSADVVTADDTTAGGTTTDSFVVVTVNDPTPNPANPLTVTATVRGTTTSASATLAFAAIAANARNISLAPASATTTVGVARLFTATVVDAAGNPVAGVPVTFTETGPGAFRDGSSTAGPVPTNRGGQATIEVFALVGESGTQTITATIPATAVTNQAAGTPAGSTGAGNNTASSTNVIVAVGTPTESPSATATPTATPTTGTTPPPNPACTVDATVTLARDTITATGSAMVMVKASPNSVVNLYAYTRPSTTYRVVRQAVVGASGETSFTVVPPANTRLYAQQEGCDPSSSVVLNVRTALSLFAERNGTRDYTFSGDSLPARPGGLIVSLYRVTQSGAQVLTAQTRASATDGEWEINRRFTGSGRFGFVVRTGQDLQNAPGASNIRPTLIF